MFLKLQGDGVNVPGYEKYIMKILSKTKLNKYACSVWDNTIYLHHSKVQERKTVVFRQNASSCIKKRGPPPATEAICKVFGPLLMFQFGFALINN